jgi:hypothetical protein
MGDAIVELNFTIDDNKVKCFTDGAKNELVENAEKHTIEIINETKRIEAWSNVGTQSVITPSHVKQAVTKSKTAPSRKYGRWYIICQIASWVGALIAGGLFDVELFKTNTIQMLACIILSIASAGCFIAVLFADYYER